jgi:hypothetical protein
LQTPGKNFLLIHKIVDVFTLRFRPRPQAYLTLYNVTEKNNQRTGWREWGGGGGASFNRQQKSQFFITILVPKNGPRGS